MALRQAALDAVLAREKPVHGRIQVVLVQRPEFQRLGEGVARRVPGKPAGGGELRAGVEDPRGDHRQHALALRRAFGVDETVEAEFAQRAEHRRNMAVGERTHDVEGVVAPTRGSSLSSRRKVSTFALGYLERLARVRFLTLPFSRQPLQQKNALLHGNNMQPKKWNFLFKIKLLRGIWQEILVELQVKGRISLSSADHCIKHLPDNSIHGIVHCRKTRARSCFRRRMRWLAPSKFGGASMCRRKAMTHHTGRGRRRRDAAGILPPAGTAIATPGAGDTLLPFPQEGPP